jgi:hypothetical protein
MHILQKFTSEGTTPQTVVETLHNHYLPEPVKNLWKDKHVQDITHAVFGGFYTALALKMIAVTLRIIMNIGINFTYLSTAIILVGIQCVLTKKTPVTLATEYYKNIEQFFDAIIKDKVSS